MAVPRLPQCGSRPGRAASGSGSRRSQSAGRESRLSPVTARVGHHVPADSRVSHHRLRWPVSLDAAEVNDEGADRMLASELQPVQTSAAQRIPQAILGVGLTTSKLSCRRNIVAVRALSHLGSLLRSEPNLQLKRTLDEPSTHDVKSPLSRLDGRGVGGEGLSRGVRATTPPAPPAPALPPQSASPPLHRRPAALLRG